MFKDKKEIIQMFNENKKVIITLGIIITAVLFMLFIVNLLWFAPNKAINSFYKEEGSETFISNQDIIKSDKFSPELRKLESGLSKMKYAVFYKGENYKKLSKVNLTDFFYLKREGLSWKVEKYESSYVPYYENDDVSYDQAFKDMKESVIKGEVKNGLTPYEEVKLNSQIIDSGYGKQPGELIDYIQSKDKSRVVEIRAGRLEGMNYLTSSNEENLNIENILSAYISTDNKYLIYTPGKYIEAITEIVNTFEVWKYNFETKSNEKIFTLEDHPNSLSFFSNGEKILIGTKNKIFSIDMSGKNYKELFTFKQAEPDTDEFIVPQVLEVKANSVIFDIPKEDYKTSRQTYSKEISLN